MRSSILGIICICVILCFSCSHNEPGLSATPVTYPDTTFSRLGDNQQLYIQLNDSLRVLEEYYPNGILSYEAHYKHNEHHGDVTNWYKSGSLMRKATYKNGKLDGPCINWKENGAIKTVVRFRDGRIIDAHSLSAN